MKKKIKFKCKTNDKQTLKKFIESKRIKNYKKEQKNARQKEIY